VTDKQALAAACKLSGDSVDAVLSYRVTESEISFVVNRGIKGCPKFVYPLDQLTQREDPEPEAQDTPVTKEPEEPAKKPTRRRRTTKK